ncbi:MAG: right-handed parallel beta-helix repeat-containing protein [Victivallales bacterium]|nr:right-handed parallel beta-helix repeat-containing protein [Victivallales bacterium]
MIKNSVLLLTIFTTVAFAEVIWKFSPDEVKLSRGTTLTQIDGGWHLANPDSRPEFFSTKAIKLQPLATYSFHARLRGTPGTKIWIVTESLRADGSSFPPTAVTYDPDALATVAKEATAGSMQLTLDGTDSWADKNIRSFVLALNAKADASDLPNINYVPVKSIAEDGTVELRHPLRMTLKTGTMVRRHWASSPYDTVRSDSAQPKWRDYSAIRKGVTTKGKETGKFMLGTDQFRIGIQVVGGSVDIAELSIDESGQIERPVTLGQNAKPELVEKARKGVIPFARLSWWGFKPDDATDIIQDALSAKVAKIIIDKTGSPWITEPLFVRSHKEVVFESGAVLEAKRGAFKNPSSTLLTCVEEQNIIIRGEGDGGIITMHKPDYQDSKQYAKSEYRHCIVIRACQNVWVENMNLLNSGGDGVVVSNLGTNFSEHIVLRKLVCDRNHRQGISIINGRHLLIEDCKLINTDGTMPQAGIDIETNEFNEPTSDIIVRNCDIIGNTGTGIQVSVTRMDTRVTGPVDITFDNCLVKDNKQADLLIHTRTRWERENHELKGQIRFVNCHFESDFPNDTRRYPIAIEMDMRHGLAILFEKSTLKRTSNTPETFRIAFSDPNGKPPAATIDFSGLTMAEQHRTALISDHSYLGDTSWLRGFDCKPLAFKNPTPWQGVVEPIESTNSHVEFPLIPLYWRSDFWICGNAGDQAEFELDYSKRVGRGNLVTKVSLVAPSGKVMQLGQIEPETTKSFKITLQENGFHHIKVRGEKVFVALKNANLPAGIMTDPYARTFLNYEGDVYFFVPEGSPDFAVRAWGRSNILFVGFEIYAPNGEKVFDVPTTNGAQFDPTPEQRKMTGVWRLHLKRPEHGYFAKCHVAFPGLPPYLGILPNMLPTKGK